MDKLFLTTKPTEDYYRYQKSIYEKLKLIADGRPGKYADISCAKENFGVFFEFVEPDSSTAHWCAVDGTGDSMKFQPWSKNDKWRIKTVLLTILADYPGLVLSSSPGERLKLARCDKYDRKYSGKHTMGATAVANYKSPIVCMTDGGLASSVDKEALKETLIHELAHLIDYGDQYSLSKDWIKIAGKKLRVTDVAWKNNDLDEVKKICQQVNLPGFYSSFNLQECFAESITMYLLNDLKEKEIHRLLKEKLISGILYPSDEICLWKIKYANGVRAHHLGDLQKAKILFSQARKINPNVLCLLNYQARNHYFRKEYPKGLRFSKRAVRHLLRIKHSCNDNDINNLKICYAHHLFTNKKFHLAIRIYNDLIENQKKDFYQARASCYENLGKYYGAASDYIKGNVPLEATDYRASYSVTQDDFESSLKSFNEKVSKYPDSTDYRRKRAIFLSGIVLSEYDCKDKDRLFETALNDFETVLNITPYKVASYKSYLNHRKRVEYDCIRLCCHNTKLKLAIEHCKNILAFDPQNHKVLAIVIGAYTRLGDKKNASRYYKKLDEQITAKQRTKDRLGRCHDLRFMNFDQFNCDEKPVLQLILKDLMLVLKDYKSNDSKPWLSKSSECMRVESLCARICFRLKDYKQALKHCENLISNDSDIYDKIAHVVKIGSLERMGEKKKTLTAFNTFKKKFKFSNEK